MTRWVRPTGEGRASGPAGLATAWVAVLFGPARFFDRAVRPGDQAPGLVFAMAVAGVAAGTRLALVPSARPDLTGGATLDALLALAAVVLLGVPLALHLAAAVQTLVLIALLEERAGISETVQVLAYATAPCALAGLPVPGVRALVGTYGAVLLAVGLRVRHDVTTARAALAAAPVAALIFGYGYGGVADLAALLPV